MKTIAKTTVTVFIVLCFTAAVSAATFVVNTAADTLDANLGNGVCEDAGNTCSLRAAISEANALAGADIITLGAVTYTQSIPNSGVNETNLDGDLDITSEITINGVSQASTILQAATSMPSATDRVLDVRPGGNLTLTNVTVRNGRTVAGLPPPGGGIRNSGILKLIDVTVRDNLTGGGEGGGGGGGISNSGSSLTLINTTVTANSAKNINFTAWGGGIESNTSGGSIVITDSSISGNSTEGNFSLGSGIALFGTYNLTVTGSHFDNNSSTNNLGSLGAGLYAGSNNGTQTLGITGSTFNGNSGTGVGGQVSGSGLMFNTDNVAAAKITAFLDKVTIDGNSGNGFGIGIFANSNGGPINFNVSRSTLSNNGTALTGGAVDTTKFDGLFQSNVVASFVNTTMSGNSAQYGGAIATHGTYMHFEHCTLSGNTASNRAGAISDYGGGQINIKSTIVAGNTAPLGPDIYAIVHSQDYNHVGDLSGGFVIDDIAHNTTGDAMLGPLQNNGGPTLTYLPAAGSPVIDAIPLGTNGCGTTFPDDQRGLGRPWAAGCDKGSVERGGLAAGPWSVSGVGRTTTGQPIRNAAVTISGGSLPAPITVFTGTLGTYQFTNLTGNEYTLVVSVKRYHFNDPLLVVSLDQNITDADFVANAPFSREVLDLGPVKGK